MGMRLRSHAHLKRVLHRLRAPLLQGKVHRSTRASLPVDTRSWLQPPAGVDAAAPADLVVRNAALLAGTGDDTRAIAISGNRIVCVDTWDKIEPFIGDKTRVIDALGHTVAPGFSDCHVHLLVGAERFGGLSVEEVRARAELADRIRRFAADHPGLEALHVYGLHYLDPPLLPTDRPRLFLDELVPDRPLFVYAHDLHTGWANTRAITEAGLMHAMPPYPDLLEHLHLTDNVLLDATAMPGGELKEPDVYFLVEGQLRANHPLPADSKLSLLQRALHALATRGITSVHNMGLAVPEEDIELLMLLLELEELHRLPIRVWTSYSVLPDEHMLDDVRHAAVLRDRLLDARRGMLSASELHDFLLEALGEATELRHDATLELIERSPAARDHPHLPLLSWLSHHLRSLIAEIHLKTHLQRAPERRRCAVGKSLDRRGMVHLGAIKLFVDGVIEKDTAYRADRSPRDGVPAFPPPQLEQVVVEADRLGLQVAAHCIGDAAVRAMLDAVEVARSANRDIDAKRGHRVRHRIEHIEICRPEDIPRFGPLDVIASMQPLHQHAPPTLWHEKVAVDQWGTAFPWRGLEQSGARLVFGSDWPIVSCNCLEAVHRAANRVPWRSGLPDQGLSLTESLTGFTQTPAWAEYREDQRGRIEAGMLADLIVLSADLRQVAPHQVDAVEVRCAICDGRVLFDADR